MAARTIDRLGGLLLVLLTGAIASRADGAALDQAGDINLGVRAYTAARVATQDTDIQLIQQAPGRITQRSLTFPVSAAGHLRQSRSFVEATLEHNLDGLVKKGFGPLGLLHDLPFQFRKLGYFLSYRGEYDGVYDYGPAEYRTAYQYYNRTLVPASPFGGDPDIGKARQHLRDTAVLRNRLFQAYVEADMGRLFLRFGRQILAWGETDVFRLLDNINPLDNGFGGFLVPLDERRVPLDMLRASYSIGAIPGTPFFETFLEGFASIDNKVGYSPGIPIGSPWSLPNFVPSASQLTFTQTPARTFDDIRGGVQLKFMASVPVIETATFGLAHYYTYLDNPAVNLKTQNFPFPVTTGPGAGFSALAVQSAPRVAITGGSASFAIPPEWARLAFLSSEPIVRTEFAYFHNEPRWSQQQLDPFVFALPRGSGPACPQGRIDANGFCSAGARTGNSVNLMVGFDTQQAIRWLNPNASFFITTQFFYKHLRGALPRTAIQTPAAPLPGQPVLFNGEVFPVQRAIYSPDRWGLPTEAAEPEFVHNAANQYLQTLLIGTTYLGGKVTPSLSVLFDWSGSVVVQPNVTYSYDPFRFILNYSYLWASDLRANSGTSLLRDRDNVLFQLEYVL